MDEIIKKHNSINPLNYNDFLVSEKSYSYTIGDGSIYAMLNLPKWTFNYFYPIDSTYLKFEYRYAEDLSKEKEVMLNKNGNDYFIFVFGDSMTTNIINFFWYTFRKTLLHRQYDKINMINIENKILKNKPDIAVMIIYYHNFKNIKLWYE